MRLLVSRHFTWRSGGPVHNYIHEKLQRVLRTAARECAEVVDGARSVPRERHGAAFVPALRRWSYSGFRPFERWQDGN